jgi:hypothetical protein
LHVHNLKVAFNFQRTVVVYCNFYCCHS